jgi:hypothetical protein
MLETAWFVPDEVEVLGAMIMIITRPLHRENAGPRITNTLDRVLTSCYALTNYTQCTS